MKFFAAFLSTLLLCPTAPTKADDGYFGGFGSAVFPLVSQNIEMARETVELKLNQGVVYSTCTFYFVNHGPATEALVGFPEKMRESPYEGDTSPPEPTIQDFTAYVNGSKTSFEIRKFEPNPELSGLEYNRVFVTRVKFKAGEQVVVKHTYNFQASGNSNGLLNIGYVLKTGALWKGPIGRAEITFDVGRKDYSEKLLEISPGNYTYKNGVVSWDLRNIKPTEDINVQVHPEEQRHLYADSVDQELRRKALNVADDGSVSSFLNQLEDFKRKQYSEDLDLSQSIANWNAHFLSDYRKTLLCEIDAGRRYTRDIPFNAISSIATFGIANPLNDMDRGPESLRYDPGSKTLFILDSANYRVRTLRDGKFGPDIQLHDIRKERPAQELFNIKTSGVGRTSGPVDLELAANGDIYVLNALAGTLAVHRKKSAYSKYDEYRILWGLNGESRIIAIGDSVYVLSNRDQIAAIPVIFHGKPLTPDEQGKNHLDYIPTGEHEGITFKPTEQDKAAKDTKITAIGKFSVPTALGWTYFGSDHNGYSYFHSYDSHIESQKVLRINKAGEEASIFNAPCKTFCSATVDPDSNVYIVDVGGNSVVIYRWQTNQSIKPIPDDYRWDKEKASIDYAQEDLKQNAIIARLIRNEIFARHGYIFHDQNLRGYFQDYTWYKPNGNFDPKQFNEAEKRNIDYLKEYEAIAQSADKSKSTENVIPDLEKWAARWK